MTLEAVSFVRPRGDIVRDCPGTRNHVCCGYKTIDLVEGCPLSCSYCILQAYMNRPGIRITDDIDYVIGQIDEAIDRETEHVLRFGTGELSDSLALDRKYKLNWRLIDYFGRKKRAILELKSKWASIDHLISHLNPYTVISFSLAPQQSIDREEKKTSPLYKRLKTARRAQEAGCFVGLHFDPIIIYPGFEKDYDYLIDDIGRILDPEKIIWLSMGLLRFPAPLFDRFLSEGRKSLLYGEFSRGEDGKYRYVKQERIRIYSRLYTRLMERCNGLFVYLCMERPDVWEKVTGTRLDTTDDLYRRFDSRIEHFYGGTL